jgi:hypothetical protein
MVTYAGASMFGHSSWVRTCAATGDELATGVTYSP